MEKESKANFIFKKLLKKLKSKKAKEYGRLAAGGAIAGVVGSTIPTVITYPIDTKNIREQAGQPAPRTLKEKYQGIDTKLLKTVASIGATFAIATPLEKYIKGLKYFKS